MISTGVGNVQNFSTTGGGKVSLPALNSGLDSLSMGVVKPPGLWILVGPG